ncbi:MAG: hypothetical protein N2F24_15420 [Deltaproteobacteria bacterium]
MKTIANRIMRVLFIVILIPVAFSLSAEAKVKKEGDRTFIVDRTGERWDITQAVSMGFDPYQFEFGIGRDAFHPLSQDNWDSDSARTHSNLRVIGIAEDGDAHAYSVNRLRYHETANTFLGSEAVVAGY